MASGWQVLSSLTKLALMAILLGTAAARQILQSTEESTPQLAEQVWESESSDVVYHGLRHSHRDLIPDKEGATRWFIRRSDILGGRRLVTAEYLLGAVRRFERRYAGVLGSAPEEAGRRRLLASPSTPRSNPNGMQLYGELDRDSLYWAELRLGTPPTQIATVQVDTGSDLLWIQCSQCQRCVPTRVPPYRPSLSSSSSYPNCSQCPALNRTLCPVGQCSISCQRSGVSNPPNACQSVYGYGDNSQVLFNVQSDVITFQQVGGSNLSTPILFGCDIAETAGLITNLRVNGLMGLGRSSMSVPSQLYAAGKIKQDSLSVCLGGFEGGGMLLFGNDTTPPKDMVYTPMGKGNADTLYNTTMTAVKVGNATLAVPPIAFYNASNDRPDAIFDTGSDLIALPGLLFDAIFQQLNESIALPPVSFQSIVAASTPPSPSTRAPTPTPTPTSAESPVSFADSLGPPTCYQLDSALANGAATSFDASEMFPTLTFTFIGNASLLLHPEDYIEFVATLDPISTRSKPVYLLYACPFILNTYGAFSLLGEYAMRNHYFTFDRTREVIGFAALNCSTFQSRPASATIPL